MTAVINGAGTASKKHVFETSLIISKLFQNLSKKFESKLTTASTVQLSNMSATT